MLFINNDEVQKVLTMEDTLRVIEEGHRELARGDLAARPRESKKKSFHGRLIPLIDLIAGKTQGRFNDEEITASSGVKAGGEDSVKGLQFVTVSSLVYDRAKQAGLGREIPTEWFLQTIRD